MKFKLDALFCTILHNWFRNTKCFSASEIQNVNKLLFDIYIYIYICFVGREWRKFPPLGNRGILKFRVILPMYWLGIFIGNGVGQPHACVRLFSIMLKEVSSLGHPWWCLQYDSSWYFYFLHQNVLWLKMCVARFKYSLVEFMLLLIFCTVVRPD